MTPGPALGLISNVDGREGARVPVSLPHRVAWEPANLTALHPSAPCATGSERPPLGRETRGGRGGLGRALTSPFATASVRVVRVLSLILSEFNILISCSPWVSPISSFNITFNITYLDY